MSGFVLVLWTRRRCCFDLARRPVEYFVVVAAVADVDVVVATATFALVAAAGGDIGAALVGEDGGSSSPRLQPISVIELP